MAASRADVRRRELDERGVPDAVGLPAPGNTRATGPFALETDAIDLCHVCYVRYMFTMVDSQAAEAVHRGSESGSAAVEVRERWLRVSFGARGHGDFHLRWLRHNCDRDLHPLTRERTVCSSELPDDLRAAAAFVAGDVLVVRWAHDERESRYPLAWLEEPPSRSSRPSPPPASA